LTCLLNLSESGTERCFCLHATGRAERRAKDAIES
jgi:hypothetical protein